MQTSETLIMRRPIVALHDVDKHYMPHLGDIARAAALRHVKGRHALSELARMTAMRLIPSLCGHMAKSAEHAEQVPPMTEPVPANFHGMSTGKTVRFHLHRSSSDLRALKSPRLLSPHHPMKTVSTETMAAETVLTDTMPMEAVTTGAMVYDHVEAYPITEGTPTLTATEVTALTPTLMGVTMPDVLAEVTTPEAPIPDASAQGWGNVLALSENPHPVATHVVEDGKPQPVDGNKDVPHRGTLSLGMSLPTHDHDQTQAQYQDQEEEDEKMTMMRALSSLNRMGEVQGHGIGAPRTSHGGRLTITVPGRFLKGERMRQRDVMVESVPIVMKGQQPQAAQVKRHAPLVDMATQISDAERMIEVDHTAAVNVRSMLHKLRRTLSELEHRVQNALRPTRPHEA